MHLLNSPTSIVGSTVSGKLGSIVYAHGVHGPYSYQFTPRVDPATFLQRLIRGRLTLSVTDWQAQSESFRALWAVWANNVPSVSPVGKTRYPTGFNRFIGASILQRTAGNPPPFPAPHVFTLARLSPPRYAFVFLSRRLRINFDLADPWRFQANGAVFIYQSLPQPSTVNYWNGPWVRIAIQSGDPLNPPVAVFLILPHPPNAARPVVFFRIIAIEEDNRLSPQNVQRALATVF